MIALGMSNICGSFFRSMPTTGSFTRTAINNASGVQTPLGGVFTGTLVILALSFLTVTFQFIPKATLAAVIITAMIFMFEAHAFKLLWNTKSMFLNIQRKVANDFCISNSILFQELIWSCFWLQ